ncbi:MAG: sodium/proline symporter PutP [Gammaproteobacteria bacterium]|nr:sodium/proline symporter PutP [Gammaproteobacteria bacterium]
MSTATFISFLIYLCAMLGIGVWAYFQTRNLSDYILGGRKLGGLVTALSAGASDMSGWLLLGLPGAIYISGLGETWIALGLIIGAYFNWRITAPRLRVYTELANNSITLPEYFTNRFEDTSHVLRVISALVIVVFFTVYVASGLTAGAKLFEASFEISYVNALLIGALVIVSYTFFGGFLAVSWTDVVQGLLMVTALVVAPVVMFFELGNLDSIATSVTSVNPELADWFNGKSPGEFFLSISFFSLMAWGLGYYGQPHLLARFMAAKSIREVHKARRIGMSWMILSVIGSLAVGYFGIAYFAGSEHQALLSNDGEKVFILATQVLFNEWVAGFLLAAILAAVMSTIDSQLLVSSSAVTEDFYRVFFRRDAKESELVWVGRFAVLLIAVIAILISVDKNARVLELVSNAWAGFGSAFGPVIVISLLWKGMTRNGAIAGMLVGALTVILWITYKDSIGGWVAGTYEMIPGVLLSTVVILVVSKFQMPSITMVERHQQVLQLLKNK